MNKLLFSLLLLGAPLCTWAQSGSVTTEMLTKFRKHSSSKADKAIQNALIVNGIDLLATRPNTAEVNDTYFSNEAPSKGITDQAASGRCWLFTGLNVMRAHVIKQQALKSFEFSQSFNSFYDQLEKANLFLQSIIDKADKPMSDKTVEWLFKNPISDGGTFTGVQDIVTKYGAVPAEVMPESYNANNTSRMASLISLKLREHGLTLRKAYAAGERGKQLAARTEEMLSVIYRILTSCLGEPPTAFTYAVKSADGRPMKEEKYTPLSFYQRFVGWDLENNYVLLMNDPTRPYHKTYAIDLDRHTYDGHNWTYLNLPIEEIKQMAIASIKDSVRMYMSCDVGKFYNKKSGVLGMSGGISSDFRDIENAAADGNKLAEVALEAFRYRIIKYVGAYIAAMGGVDAICFTAGVGENDKETRRIVGNAFGYLGAKIDDNANNVRGKRTMISTPDSKVKLILMPTNEELAIARDAYRLAKK